MSYNKRKGTSRKGYQAKIKRKRLSRRGLGTLLGRDFPTPKRLSRGKLGVWVQFKWEERE